MHTKLAFHSLIDEWFRARFGESTPPQTAGWRHIASGAHTLIAAPTGSGKTLAAFLWSINELVEQALAGTLAPRTQVVYVSPLKALANDIEKNLQQPLREIEELAASRGLHLPEIRVAVRTGDTPARDREKMRRQPPHILITTPESLFILLTAERSRGYLSTATTVIVDEIHAVAGDKRGAHLAISLERLDALCERRLQRIGLSATQKPIEEIARLLGGQNNDDAATGRRGDGATTAPFVAQSLSPPVSPSPSPLVAVVDVGHRRALDLAIEVPDPELGPIASHELRAEVYDRIAQHVRAHRTTLVFTNTRRLVERVAHQLGERLGADQVAAHHGSLSRKTRLDVEQRLKSGDLPVVVATASLELGIDIGHVDLVCHLGAPRALATLLQRVGRAGHWKGAIPKGILFPITRDELVQCAAALRAVRAGELDRIIIPEKPLDILAQQMVAIAATASGTRNCDRALNRNRTRAVQTSPEEHEYDYDPDPDYETGIRVDDLFALIRRAYQFRNLTRAEFDEVLTMLSEGVATSRGRRGAHLHHDRVNGIIRGRRGARLIAITNGGAIPEVADYDVIEEPTGALVGKINEDFAIESMAGDVFLLGNTSWRIRRVERSKVRVENAHAAAPTVPFWLGEAPARTMELSRAVCDLRDQVATRLNPLPNPSPQGGEGPRAEVVAWLQAESGVSAYAAQQIVEYISASRRVLGVIPTMDTVVAERFFDEAGGMQLVLHTPFGGRINRAWGFAMRKRFCLTFDFELQAAATDDGIVLSLGEQHSFPLDNIFAMIRLSTLREDLIQAMLVSPMFGNRWRWNATRAFALLRFQNGKKVPMPIQRMRSDDLLAAVFPDQVGCQDNHAGPIIPPDHPLVNETIDNCLHEAMDLDGLRAILEAIQCGDIKSIAVETPAPSPICHEILNANPYAFLDDAPLEERRARAVSLRQIEPDLATGVGALDAAAIAEVRRQAWPDIRDADELHDFLLTVGVLPSAAAREWQQFADALISARRATVVTDPSAQRADNVTMLVAAERLPHARAMFGDIECAPAIIVPDGIATDVSRDDALVALVQGWMETVGPITAAALADRLGLLKSDVEIALATLESRGIVMQGTYTRIEDRESRIENGIRCDPLSSILDQPKKEDRGSRIEDEGRCDPRSSILAPRAVEWCERRLLARIHRLTLGRLRREIEPVTTADFIRFLLRWQHVAPGTQLHGRDGLLAVIQQLQGLELPAVAWETSVLPSRVASTTMFDLEHLCLAGVVTWGRLSHKPVSDQEEEPKKRRRSAPTRNAPLAFMLREGLGVFLNGHATEWLSIEGLSTAAREVARFLEQRGASFLTDVATGTGQMKTTVEEALWELVARGVVTGDGIAGLRALLRPEDKRNGVRMSPRLRGGASPRAALPVGRWSLWSASGEAPCAEHRSEQFARQLLARYGLVFRELLARESQAPSWRALLVVFRRLEARGEVRGGRFLGGFIGEQFALPEAVDALRCTRRLKPDGETVLVAAADPLNLVGILTPGARLSPFANQVIAYRDGEPITVGTLGAVKSQLQG